MHDMLPENVLGNVSCRRHRVEARYEWKVENFGSLIEEFRNTCCSYFSPDFVFSSRTFRLHLYPAFFTFVDGKQEAWIGLFLGLNDSGPSPLNIRCTLGIKTASGDTKVWESDTNTLPIWAEYVNRFGSLKLITTSELFLRRQQLMPLNALTFTIIMKIADPDTDRGTNEETVATSAEDVGIQEANKGLRDLEHTGTAEVAVQTCAEDVGVREASEGRRNPEHSDLAALGQNLKDLFVSGKDSDVTLEVMDKTFRAHKLILGARTPVLSAMFSHNTAEAETGVVGVEDCNPKAFEIFLRFVYSGVAENLTEQNVTDVYYIADKYDLSGLKEQCVRQMLSNLTTSSVCSVIALADRHAEEMLQERATEFFVGNAREILKTPSWKKFMAQHNSLAFDLLNRFLENEK